MGEQKLLLPLREKPVLQWVLESVLASDVSEVICVVRNLESLPPQISIHDDKMFWLINSAADRGQSTSVIAGLWAIDPNSEGALFVVGDQPMIRADMINALIERFERTTALIVAPGYHGQTRNPVLFRREIFPELLELSGDRGGRVLIEKYKDRTEIVEWHDELSFFDLDVRQDYEKLKELA